jgi:hypothetical protein
MSTSTDAILFYGIQYEDGTEFTWYEQYDSVDEWYAEKMGLPVPRGEYDEREYEKYLKARRPILAKMGVEVGYHCSAEYPMTYIAITGTETIASRGYPEEIDPKKMIEPPPDQIQKLRDFIELAGLEWAEPRWWLVSYWG